MPTFMIEVSSPGTVYTPFILAATSFLLNVHDGADPIL
jgi:hypothetical protein